MKKSELSRQIAQYINIMMCRIPGAMQDSSKVNAVFEESCHHRKMKDKFAR